MYQRVSRVQDGAQPGRQPHGSDRNTQPAPRHGVEQPPLAGAVDLAPEVADVDVHDIALGVEVEPHTCSASMGRVRTRPTLRRKYSRRAYSRAVSVMRRAPRRTSRVAGSRVRSSRRSTGARAALAAAEERPHPRQQLVERKRLGEVVVGALVEPGHLVGHGIAGGEEQHRRLHARGPGRFEDPEAVEPGQHHVEDHEVVRRTAGQKIECGGAIGRQLDGIPSSSSPWRMKLTTFRSSSTTRMRISWLRYQTGMRTCRQWERRPLGSSGLTVPVIGMRHLADLRRSVTRPPSVP